MHISHQSYTYPSRATHIQPELHASDRFYPALIEHMWKLENTYCLPRVISQSSVHFQYKVIARNFPFQPIPLQQRAPCIHEWDQQSHPASPHLSPLSPWYRIQRPLQYDFLSKKKQLNTYTATVNSTLVGKECCGKVWSKTHAWKLANTVVHFVSR